MMEYEKIKVVSDLELAEQLVKTSPAARFLVAEIGPKSAMSIMEICAGKNLRFPRSSSIKRAVIVALIMKGMGSTNEGDATKRVKGILRNIKKFF